MENLNSEIQDYFREEIRQCKIMLNGVLNTDYRQFVSKKVRYFKYVVDLLEKEEVNEKRI